MRHLEAAVKSKIGKITGSRPAPQAASPQREARLRTQLRSGSIHDVNQRKLSDCLFLNISLHGARLRMPAEMRVPPKLIIVDERLGIKFSADVRWHRGQEIGIYIPEGVASWMPHLSEDGGRTRIDGHVPCATAPNSSATGEDRRRDSRSFGRF